MCGIFGILSASSNISILDSLTMLKRLEYRGYDSAGIMFLASDKKPKVIKKKGKIKELENSISHSNFNHQKTNFLMSHTRWATHGQPNDTNSHPHISLGKKFYLVHNGIIENYHLLREILLEAGYDFYSETDTEVLVNFIEYMTDLYPQNSLEKNISLALSKVKGTYGLIIFSIVKPDEIYVIKKSSPMVLGLLEDKIYISSDYYSFLENTQEIIHLQDEQMAIVSMDGLKYNILNMTTQEEITPDILNLDIKLDEIEKSVFQHFMLQEIMKQSESIQNCLRGRIVNQKKVKLGGLDIKLENKTLIQHLANARQIIICACGTSLHSAMIGKYIIEELADIPVQVEQASEFRYRYKSIPSHTVIIGVSQSGETADTLEAIRSLHKTYLCLGICNVVASSLSQITQGGVYLHVGPEIGVASTKAFTGQLTILYLLAMKLAEIKGINQFKREILCLNLQKIPNLYESVIDKIQGKIKMLAKTYKFASNFLFLGRGYNYPIALEAALKLKEISYIHAEGYSAAEMKHGPIALIDKMMPVVVIAMKDSIYPKVLSNVEEVYARGGSLIIVTEENNRDFDKMTEDIIYLPEIEEQLYPFLTILPLQLLAYYIAVERGCDVDQPRNLAKCVTVE